MEFGACDLVLVLTLFSIYYNVQLIERVYSCYLCVMILLERLKTFLVIGLLLVSFSVTSQVNYDYFLRVGNADMMNEQYVDAINKFNIAILANEEGFEAYFLRGIAKFSLGDYQGAVNDFTKTLDIHTLYTRAYFYRGICNDRLYDYAHALSDYNKALEIDPFNSDVYMARGDTRIHLHDFKGAVKDYSKAIQLDSKQAGAYLNRGVAHHFLKQDSAAISDMNRAIQLDYYNMDAWIKRGMIMYEMDSLQTALSDFNHVIKTDPSYPLVYFQRALTWLKLQDTVAALQDYNSVLKLDSANSLTYYNRALVYSMQGEYEKALDDYNKVVELNPYNVYGYYNRGVDCFSLKRYREAEEDFTRALKIFPDFVGAYINRAAARSRLGDTKGAYADQMTAESIIKKINGDDNDIASLYSRYSDSTYFDKIMEFEADFMSGNMKRGRIQFNRVKIEPKADFFIVNAFRLPDSVYNKYSKAEFFDENLTQFNTSNRLGIRLTFTTRQWPVSEEKAIDELQRFDSSILIRGDTAGAWFMKGVINSMLQNYSVAIDAYNKALKYNPDMLYAWFNRAASRVERDEFIYSDQQYQNTITISMTSGSNKQTRKIPPPNHRQSLNDYNRVILIYPGLPFTYYNRANLKILLKDYQSAINDYSKAIELEPKMAEAYFNRALTLLFLREDKLACKDLSKSGELGLKESYNIIKRYCGK